MRGLLLILDLILDLVFSALISVDQRQKSDFGFSPCLSITNPKFPRFLRKFFIENSSPRLRASAVQLVSPVFLRVSVPSCPEVRRRVVGFGFWFRGVDFVGWARDAAIIA